MLPSVTAARHPLEVFGPGSNPGGAATLSAHRRLDDRAALSRNRVSRW